MADRESGRSGEIGAGTGQAIALAFEGCHGWLHPAAGRRAVVLCGPIGYEAICCHRPWAVFAAALADAGLPTLRFDYPGCGDSRGDGTDPGLLHDAVAAIRAAVALMRGQAGIEEVALVGLRFGALLAASAAQELARAGAPIDALVLIAPCASGAAYANELRVLSRMAKQRSPGEDAGLPGLEAAGFHYTLDILAAMKALDPTAGTELPAPRILLADRTDHPSGAALRDSFRRLGAVVEEHPFAEYNALMRDAEDATYPARDCTAVIGWLAAGLPAASPAPIAWALGETGIAVTGGVEAPVWIEVATPLFGILAEPTVPAADRPLLLILNTGYNHHIGTNRMSVLMARRLLEVGVASLRFDLGGIGDSPTVPNRARDGIATPDCVAEVRQAVDWLARRGYRRIVVTGLCAGGVLAYRATLAEPRITGQILLNVQNLWPRPLAARQFESNRDYLRLLFAPRTWSRLLQGEIQVRAIAVVLLSRVRESLSMRLKRLIARDSAASPAARTVAELTNLAARGISTEFIYVQSDRGVDELELYFGHHGKALGGIPGVRCTFIDQGDHLFSFKASRNHLLELMVARFTAESADAAPVPAPEAARRLFKGSPA